MESKLDGETARFFPSSKKMFDNNYHQNSKEFKQLGYIHRENRVSDYAVVDTTPMSQRFSNQGVLPSDFAKLKLDEEIDQFIKNGETDLSGQIDTKYRAAHLKHLIGSRLREENMKSAAINHELKLMRANSAMRSTTSNYPPTTNQEFINEE